MVALQGGGGVQPGQRRVSRQLVPVVRPSARENLKIKTKMTLTKRFNDGTSQSTAGTRCSSLCPGNSKIKSKTTFDIRFNEGMQIADVCFQKTQKGAGNNRYCTTNCETENMSSDLASLSDST